MGKEKEFQLPADLTALSDADLAQLETDANAEFDGAYDAGDLARVTSLGDGISALQGEKNRRTTAQAELQVELQKQRDRIRPQQPEVAPEPVAAAPAPAAAEPLPAAVQPPAVVTTPLGTVPPMNGAVETLLAGGTMRQAERKLNPTLADMRRNAPATKFPDRRSQSVLVASADIPGVRHASELSDMDALVAAMTAKARTLSVTRQGDDAPMYPVASLQLDHRYMLDLGATPEQINEVLTAATDVDAMVAAGGWCSPSEISYDFYNIVCEDGMLDLPSAGINRGGMRWPTSATFADIMGGVNNFFTWTETQDIAALTGTAQSGTKVCARVPCPGFNEARLRCDGLCLTVGNLTNDAYPELIANHTRLLFAGQAHRLNTLRINTLLDPLMSTPITGYGVAGQGLVAPVLGALELSAIDYREKFAMCEDSVLEVVLPRWLRGAMRSDLRKRGGVDLLEVSDARLMNMFDMLNIRVQWVTDWQVRTAGLPGFNGVAPTTWPTSVQFLMFAAGTFLWGRGLQLNLGVVRDSVLNATNDYTAEWMEECWLIAKIGHESRLGTIPICANGATGLPVELNCRA